MDSGLRANTSLLFPPFPHFLWSIYAGNHRNVCFVPWFGLPSVDSHSLWLILDCGYAVILREAYVKVGLLRADTGVR